MDALITILAIMFIHWVADFILQTDEEAKGKSTSFKCLVSHTFHYSMIWFAVGTILALTSGLSLVLVAYFTLITFIAHTITDYFTSKLNSYLWKKGDTHNFFVSIGFDQFLHHAQLLITYYFLIG